MSNKSNVSAVRNDMRDILEGGQRKDGGQVSLAFNLVPLLDSPIVHRWAEDGNEYVDDFAVRDFIVRKPKNEQGGLHKNLQTARRNAILSNLFGYGEEAFDNGAVKSALDKALPSAIVLQHYYTGANGKLSLSLSYFAGDVEGRKRVIAGVPAADMFDLVTVDGEGRETLTAAGKRAMDKGDEAFFEVKGRLPKNDDERRSFMLARPLVTSGAPHSTYGIKALTAVQFLEALKARGVVDGIIPAGPPRNTKGKDAGKSLSEAVAFVVKEIDGFLTADESAEPLTLDMERKLDELAERWAAYRVANPREMLDF
jgi:hypothetical protein